jgi:hypothetical protein
MSVTNEKLMTLLNGLEWEELELLNMMMGGCRLIVHGDTARLFHPSNERVDAVPMAPVSLYTKLMPDGLGLISPCFTIRRDTIRLARARGLSIVDDALVYVFTRLGYRVAAQSTEELRRLKETIYRSRN